MVFNSETNLDALFPTRIYPSGERTPPACWARRSATPKTGFPPARKRCRAAFGPPFPVEEPPIGTGGLRVLPGRIAFEMDRTEWTSAACGITIAHLVERTRRRGVEGARLDDDEGFSENSRGRASLPYCLRSREQLANKVAAAQGADHPSRRSEAPGQSNLRKAGLCFLARFV